MKFVSITSDEIKEALLEGNRISVRKQTFNDVKYAVDNPSDVYEYFKFDNDNEQMFFGYVTNSKKNKYVFLLMQNMHSSDTEKCLDSLIDLMTILAVEAKQKSLKIKDLESELENVLDDIDLIDEADKFNDELTEDDINVKSTVNGKPTVDNQVKLPSQKSYITIDNFDIFI